jgi:hypothetical protein
LRLQAWLLPERLLPESGRKGGHEPDEREHRMRGP